MKYIVNFLKGVIFGIAVVIPGLSGSAFLVVLGVYDGVINAITNLRKKLLSNLLYLMPIGVGAIIGVLMSTKLVLSVCSKFPVPSYLFFIVLVVAAYPDIIKKARKKSISVKMVLLIFAGFLFLITINYVSELIQGYAGEQIDSYIAISDIRSFKDSGIIVFSGLLSCGLMTIPGVSGSVILMMIGQYGTVYNAVSELNLPIVFLFALGSALGIIIASKILKHVIAKFESEMYYVVIGILSACIVTILVTGVMNIRFVDIIGRLNL